MFHAEIKDFLILSHFLILVHYPHAFYIRRSFKQGSSMVAFFQLILQLLDLLLTLLFFFLTLLLFLAQQLFLAGDPCFFLALL